MRVTASIGSVATLTLLSLTLQACATARVRRGHEVDFVATAYCGPGITKSGVKTREGLIAADPRVLPLGSVVRIVAAGDRRYERTYTVMDIGDRVQGRRIDLFVRDCAEARRFGVRQVHLEVVQFGSGSEPRR